MSEIQAQGSAMVAQPEQRVSPFAGNYAVPDLDAITSEMFRQMEGESPAFEGARSSPSAYVSEDETKRQRQKQTRRND